MILNLKEAKMEFDKEEFNRQSINSEDKKKPFLMEFDLPKEQSSIIKVIGVGGGGSNAVNHMFEKGIHGVNFIICNTDAQALEMSAIPNKIQLGPECTEGLGAGSDPNVGRMATEESLNEIKNILEKNTKMVFVTAGMGGGTGTGGAPVVAKLAKDMGMLTVGIVTNPFFFEGSRKIRQAKKGLEELRQNVDSIIVISNDKIRDIYGNLTQDDAFSRVDDIVAIAAKSISEIITISGTINVDFADVQYVMKNSGTAIMGSNFAEGEDRAKVAIKGALESPLLDENNIKGAKKILLNITSGLKQVLVDEIHEINNFILEHVGGDVEIIFGTAKDDNLGDGISVTVIATGFSSDPIENFNPENPEQKKVYTLQDDTSSEQKQAESISTPLNVEKEELFNPGLAQDQLREREESTKEPEIKRYDLFGQNDIGEEDTKGTNAENTTSWEFNFDLTPKDTAEPMGNIEIETPSNFDKEDEISSTNEINPSDDIPREESKEEEFFVIRKKGPTQENKEAPNFDFEEEHADDIERMREMKNLRKLYNDPKKLRDIEETPAWQRQNVQLHNAPTAKTQNISRYNLLDNEEDRPEIRRNNSFLHDKPD